MKEIELLAPARDIDCGIDAINCGADAVYIGAESFGARASASNTMASIARLAAYAHKFRVKVYAAVNTVLTDDELPRAVSLINKLWASGVDAVIVQDMGLLEMKLPPIPLFASTQTHNFSAEKAVFLEKVGFQRVILSRELSLDEIKKIRAASGIDIEVFVHGALCVSQSGRCYMSLSMGHRSGNRGDCAQPCRMAYCLEDGSGKKLMESCHVLSLKDLNLSEKLGELVDAGVSSFKIEGRLKDRVYIRNVVSYYRKTLDRALAERGLKKASSGISSPGFEANLAKTFNRGYTEYFYSGRPEDPWSHKTPKFVGEFVGRACALSADSFELEGPATVRNGDGLSFFSRTGELCGSFAEVVKGRRIYPGSMANVHGGMAVYRNYDREFVRSVEKAEPDRRISVALRFSETKYGFEFSARDEDGFEVSVPLDFRKEESRGNWGGEARIREQLSKLGGTAFRAVSADVSLTRDYFFPAGVLNDLRRRAVAALEENRLSSYTRKEARIIQNSFPYPVRETDFSENIINSAAASFYKRHGVESIESGAEKGLDLRGRKVMTVRACLRRSLGICLGGKKAPPLFIQDAKGRRFRLEFDCRTCFMEIYREKD